MQVIAGRRQQRGFVLVVVLFFALLLFSVVATFLRRATVDSMIIRNRDNVARAEALARGGVRLAEALILQDLLEDEGKTPMDTPNDVWALAERLELPIPDGGLLSLKISDAGARLNLNALLDKDRKPEEASEAFLVAFLEKVIEEMPVRPEEKLYDAGELARNLLDYLDEDDVRLRGGNEDDYYQEQDLPYRAANGPMLSMEDLALVEGFDAQLVAAASPYLTVHPYHGGGGVNLNTAPSHVLATVYAGTSGHLRLDREDVVERVLRSREKGERLCEKTEAHEDCVLTSSLVDQEIFPPPTYETHTFRVVAEARYGEVRRRIETVLDRQDPTQVRFLTWRMR